MNPDDNLIVHENAFYHAVKDGPATAKGLVETDWIRVLVPV